MKALTCITTFHRTSCLAVAMLMLLMMSCSKAPVVSQTNVDEQIEVVEGDAAQVRLCVNLGFSGDTKVSGMDYDRDEKPVRRWAFFIFERVGGSLAYRGSVDGGAAITKTLRVGTYDIFVVANQPTTGSHAVNVSSIYTKTQFQGLTSYLEDNGIGEFVMAGNNTFTVVKSDDVQEVVVRLKRLVSKVCLESITRDFENATLAAKPMSINRVYLTNVAPRTRYYSDLTMDDMTSPSSPYRSVDKNTWYNAMGWHSDGSMAPNALVDALTQKLDINTPITQGQTVSLNESLYFLPNPMLLSGDSHDAVWSGPRCTRLVIETVIDGRTYYYQATLPKDPDDAPIARNSAFGVKCRLTKPGSTDPEQDIPGVIDVTFTALPQTDWDNVYNVTEES